MPHFSPEAVRQFLAEFIADADARKADPLRAAKQQMFSLPTPRERMCVVHNALMDDLGRPDLYISPKLPFCGRK